MKPMFSEEYYRQVWNDMLKGDGIEHSRTLQREHYRNLEKELEEDMKIFENIGLKESDIEKIRKVRAEKIANDCRKLVLDEMRTVKDVEAGRAGFGFTTESQEIRYRGYFRRRFEFNCLQLRDFKNKYLEE